MVILVEKQVSNKDIYDFEYTKLIKKNITYLLILRVLGLNKFFVGKL